MIAFQNRFLNLTSVVLILNATDSAALFDRANAAVKAEVKIAEVAPASGKNSYYIGNRSPLLVSPFIKLPSAQLHQNAGCITNSHSKRKA